MKKKEKEEYYLFFFEKEIIRRKEERRGFRDFLEENEKRRSKKVGEKICVEFLSQSSEIVKEKSRLAAFSKTKNQREK